MKTFVYLLILTLYFAQARGNQVYDLRADRDHSPLAVTRERGKDKFELAEPREVRDKYTQFVVAEDREFVLACPRYLGFWKERIKRFFACTAEEDIADILFIRKFDKDLKCERSLKPAVKLSGRNLCYNDGEVETGEEYEIGYEVDEYDPDEKEYDADRVSIYFVCHSVLFGTHYTVYTLRSLNLLIANPYKKVKKGYSSVLGKNSIGKSHRGKRYQLLSHYEMPYSVRSWKKATFFDFNIIKVPGGKVLEYLTMVDNYIRMSMVKMGKHVTIYSGRHTTTITDLKAKKDRIQRGEKNTQRIGQYVEIQQKRISEKTKTTDETEYTFIWKILHDCNPDSTSAIIIITLIDPFEECTNICSNVSEETEWKYFTNPVPGTCTYTCSVDGIINKIFGLANLEHIPTKLHNKMTTDSSNLITFNDSLFSDDERESENGHFTDSVETTDNNSTDDDETQERTER